MCSTGLSSSELKNPYSQRHTEYHFVSLSPKRSSKEKAETRKAALGAMKRPAAKWVETGGWAGKAPCSQQDNQNARQPVCPFEYLFMLFNNYLRMSVPYFDRPVIKIYWIHLDENVIVQSGWVTTLKTSGVHHYDHLVRGILRGLIRSNLELTLVLQGFTRIP